MDKYSNKYMANHCIDLFFVWGAFPIHVLTAGSIIPDALNDILRNRTLQEKTALNGNHEVTIAISIDNSYIQSIIGLQSEIQENIKHTEQYRGIDIVLPIPSVEQISHHFRFYAKQGFYSYDCESINDDGTANYRLIAWPEDAKQIDFDLPTFAPSCFVDSISNQMPPRIITM